MISSSLATIVVDGGGHFQEYGPPSALTVVGVGLYIWVSLGLVATLWVKHRGVSVGRKLVWTAVMLCVPMGWLLFLGLFRVPGVSDTPLYQNAAGSGDSGGAMG